MEARGKQQENHGGVLNAACGVHLGTSQEKEIADTQPHPRDPSNTKLSGAWDSVFSRWFCSTIRTECHWLMGFKDSVFLHKTLVSSPKKGSHI